jgi:hypothetical protein
LRRIEFPGFAEDLDDAVGKAIKKAARGIVGNAAAVHLQKVLGGRQGTDNDRGDWSGEAELMSPFNVAPILLQGAFDLLPIVLALAHSDLAALQIQLGERMVTPRNVLSDGGQHALQDMG